MVDFVISGAGGALVLLALRDIFHTLWHPQGFGTLAQAVFSLVWRITGSAPAQSKRAGLTGPVALLGTVVLWAILVVAGFTLIYAPHMPEGFYFGSPLKPAASVDLWSSVYLSLVTVATLGYGDIVPSHPALRMLAPMQALIGFLLLTAAITWVLEVYPALARRRALARHLFNLQRGGLDSTLRTGSPHSLVPVLESLAGRLADTEMDMRQYRESYYFRDPDPGTSLAAALPVALRFADASTQSPHAEVQMTGRVLRESIDAVAHVLASTLNESGDTPAIVHAYATDHGHGQAAEAAAQGDTRFLE